jgi:hypothetical protein
LALRGGRATPKPAGLGWPNPPSGQTGVVSATPILLFGGWPNHPQGPWGGSAIPRPVMEVAQPPLFFLFQNILLVLLLLFQSFYFYFFLDFVIFIFFKLFLFLVFLFLIIQRDTCQFFKAYDVAFHQFLDGS